MGCGKYVSIKIVFALPVLFSAGENYFEGASEVLVPPAAEPLNRSPEVSRDISDKNLHMYAKHY